jgi:type I restriction enzyme, R subunit
MPDPEKLARKEIDALLGPCGWVVQDKNAVNLAVSRGVAVRELTFKTGEPDYTLFVDGKAIGTVEAKPAGHSLTGVEEQSEKYVKGVPFGIPAWRSPLPFSYESTGTETRFTNRLDPVPLSRNLFAFHRPEALLDWVEKDARPQAVDTSADYANRKGTLLTRLQHMPPLIDELWPPKPQAIMNIEQSLRDNRPRALVQMATGSGKTLLAIVLSYRLIKFAGAKRILFLVDRGNLRKQTLGEFQQYVSPYNNYKFHEEYIIQRLTSNTLDTSARVCIGTIQRLYSMLKGQELDEEADKRSVQGLESLFKEAPPIEYNPAIPSDTFDIIITDECHRSIYNLWRQVLEYFDAHLIGLTATLSKQTFGFFNQNLVMEYNHERAVADGVNVNYDVYRIQTEVTSQGAKIDAGFYVDKRDRQTRKKRWELLDEDFQYGANQLDRDVVAEGQIRTVLQTFRDKLFTEIFPGRDQVPKTLIFAKDDNHAEDIVRVCREVFDKGNDFCQKITYRTGFVRDVEKKIGPDGKEVEEVIWKKVSNLSPDQILTAFRNTYNPRIAVTVDMIATGTDVKPLEIVFFMRSVKSRGFFEQMKGRGVRVIPETEMEQVNPGIKRKTRFVIVDAVGICEHDMTDSRPLEKKRTVTFDKLLDAIALGNREPEVFESLAGRLVRLEKRFDEALESEVRTTAKGQTLCEIAQTLLASTNPDNVEAKAKEGKDQYFQPTEKDLQSAQAKLMQEAAVPLASNPALRQLLIKVHQASEQVIDVITRDRVLFAGATQQTTQNAEQVTKSFRDYIEKHKAEITALQLLYSRPYRHRLTEPMLKELENKLREEHAAWTEDRLWDAFAAVAPKKVKGRSQAGRFADLVALVRFALERDQTLQPFAQTVNQRFIEWIERNIAKDIVFTPEQRAWLELIRDHIATSLSIEANDFNYAPFSQRGGLGKAHQLFGSQLPKLLDELNEVLAA